MLSVKALTYMKERKYILSDINMELPAKKIIGFLGPNASGKTTLMQSLSGLRFLQSGEIELDGHSNRVYLTENIVYMNHELLFSEKKTGADVARFYKENCKRFNYQRFMGMVKQLDIDLDQSLKDLSRGMKERIILSLTLSQNAQYYFLDEPLSGVDMLTREEIIKSMLTFADENATIIISSHYMEVFEMLFDEVYFMKEGKVIGQVECELMREEYGMTLSEYYVKTFRGGVISW